MVFFFLLCGATKIPWLPLSYLDERVNLLRIFLRENRVDTLRSNEYYFIKLILSDRNFSYPVALSIINCLL